MSYQQPQNLFKNRDGVLGWISRSLGKTFGYGPDAKRKVAAITGATAVSADNWYERRSVMRADYLAALLAESDEMLAEFLEAIGREDLADAARRDAVLHQIETLIRTLDGEA